jgi:hypothetical protein
MSKRAIAALTSDETTDPLDERPQALAQVTAVSGDLMDTIQEVFAGTPLAADQERIAALLSTRGEIQQAWGAAAKGFVTAGRRLLELDELLRTEQEREALKAGCERLFPFSKSVGSKLRAVARAVDGGVLSLETCPASYVAAYEITLLEPPELEDARRRGLIAPRTTRAALIAFRRENAITAMQHIDIGALLAEQRRIQRRLSHIEEERRALEARLAAIVRVTQPSED